MPKNWASAGPAWLACLLLAVAGIAQAQPTISQSTAQAQPPLQPEQIGQINGFIEFYLDAMSAGQTTDDIRAARNQILGQVRLPGSSDAFREAYAAAFAEQVEPIFPDGPLIVRLNAVIILARTQQPSAFDVAAKALSDPSPAVRYWAAKTIDGVVQARSADAPPLPPAQRQPLLAALQGAASGETEPTTLVQVLTAMTTLGEVDRVIEALDARLASHVGNTDSLMLPERLAMQNLYIALVTRLAQEGVASIEATAAELSRVALLYLTVASTQLNDADAMPSATVEDRRQMIEQADQVLRWAVGDVADVSPLIPPIRTAVQIQDWDTIVAQLTFWRRELTISPFPFRPDDLELPEVATP